MMEGGEGVQLGAREQGRSNLGSWGSQESSARDFGQRGLVDTLLSDF